MEVIVNQWKEEENEVEELSLHRRRGPQHSRTTSSSSSDKDEEIKGGRIQDFVESKIEEILNVSTREVILQHNKETENGTILPAIDAPIPEDSSNVSTNEIEKLDKMNAKYQMQLEELYLERVFQKSPAHGFYCPNCNACIQKVYIQKGELEITEPIRCTSCFSFLIPIGSWLFPSLVSDENRALNDQVAPNHKAPEPNKAMEVSPSENKDPSKLDARIEGPRQQTVPVTKVEDEPTGPRGLHGHIIPGNNMTNWEIIRKTSEDTIPQHPKADESKDSDWRVIPDAPGDQKKIQVIIDRDPEVDEDVTDDVNRPLVPIREPPISESSKTLEILKSIVYGGLTESLASLSVVASAASADATTLNIVALAIANLIGGLFALVHNLGELKSEQPKRSENQTNTPTVDRYKELLGHRDHFFLHAFVAILSFIVFGLVPPLVYGFSFRESDDKDFKLAAVAGASVLCITLLSIAKAYTQRPNSYVIYFQTVLSYVATGTVASVLSYIAGDFVKNIIGKLGWFQSLSDFSLQGPGMTLLSSPGWVSY